MKIQDAVEMMDPDLQSLRNRGFIEMEPQDDPYDSCWFLTPIGDAATMDPAVHGLTNAQADMLWDLARAELDRDVQERVST